MYNLNLEGTLIYIYIYIGGSNTALEVEAQLYSNNIVENNASKRIHKCNAIEPTQLYSNNIVENNASKRIRKCNAIEL